MLGQRIYLDEDNKLVVITDNGKTNADGTITTKIDIDKEFVVSGADVIKMFGLINKTDCVFPYISEVYVGRGWYESRPTCMIATTDNAVKDALNGINEDIDRYKNEIEELSRTNKELKTALEKSKVSTPLEEVQKVISKYNDSRHWWERKIKID